MFVLVTFELRFQLCAMHLSRVAAMTIVEHRRSLVFVKRGRHSKNLCSDNGIDSPALAKSPVRLPNSPVQQR